MARPSKQREIQVQKPAQSLAHFQSKLGQPHVEEVGLLKPILIGAAVVVVLGLAFGGWQAYRSQAIDKHEAAMALLQEAVEGDGITPVPPAVAEQRMRERLPQLEALVKSAPASRRATAEGLLETWRLDLDGKAPEAPAATDPWSRIRLAERAIALGQAATARQQLEPLRGKAKPGQPWAEAYWAAVLDADRVAADRAQAWKDLAEYKARFKGRTDTGALDSLLQSI